MNMNHVLSVLLRKRLGIIGFAGADIHLDEITREDLQLRYEEAFAPGPAPHVVMVVSGWNDHSYLVESFDQMWTQGLFGNRGVSQVLRIPADVWEDIVPDLSVNLVHDLRPVPVG